MSSISSTSSDAKFKDVHKDFIKIVTGENLILKDDDAKLPDFNTAVQHNDHREIFIEIGVWWVL